MNDEPPLSRRFGRLTVTVTRGDIARQEVDAVVNAANNRFWMGGGVAGALKRAGGEELEAEAVRQGPVEPGQSVVTRGGRLPARHCIHAAVMGQDLATSADLIRTATLSALDAAAGLDAKTVAFPALGTGVGGFPLDETARLMFGAVLERAPGTGLEEVRFVLFTDEAFRAFARILEGTGRNDRRNA